MKLRKSKVSMAVAATLGLACLAPSASFGNEEKYSVETIGLNAGTLNTLSGGDTLLFPFYTIANGSVTSFSVTNISSTQVVVAKLRFREQLHSVDVYDMHVILSPNDKFDFWVQEGPSGRPQLNWDDKTCVVGPMDPDARSVEFRPAWKPFVKIDEQMRMGHVELLGVVDISKTVLAPYAMHKNAEFSCKTLAKVFKSPNSVRVLNDDCTYAPDTLTDGDIMRVALADACKSDYAATDESNVELSGYGFLKDVGNVLIGRYIVSSRRELGMEAGGDAIAIRDTDIPNPSNSAHSRNRWSITAHSETLCADVNPPNCRTFNLYQWDLLEQAHPHLGEMWNLAGFQLAMGARAVGGDWSNNPDNKVNVDWMVSFPTKYAYMNFNHAEDRWELLYHPTAQQDISGNRWPFADGVWFRSNVKGDASTANINLNSVFRVWGTEENGTGDVSPGDPFLVIPNEANIFTLLNTLVLSEPWESVIQVNGDDRLSRTTVDFQLPNAKRGWARMALQWPSVVSGIGVRVVDFDVDGAPGSANCTIGGKPGVDIGSVVLDRVPTNLAPDNTCDDLYNTERDAGEPAGDYPRLYLPGEDGDDIADAVDCELSPYLCEPPADAVTGIIFTTRDTGNVGNNDATLTELQKIQ